MRISRYPFPSSCIDTLSVWQAVRLWYKCTTHIFITTITSAFHAPSPLIFRIICKTGRSLSPHQSLLLKPRLITKSYLNGCFYDSFHYLNSSLNTLVPCHTSSHSTPYLPFLPSRIHKPDSKTFFLFSSQLLHIHYTHCWYLFPTFSRFQPTAPYTSASIAFRYIRSATD